MLSPMIMCIQMLVNLILLERNTLSAPLPPQSFLPCGSELRFNGRKWLFSFSFPNPWRRDLHLLTRHNVTVVSCSPNTSGMGARIRLAVPVSSCRPDSAVGVSRGHQQQEQSQSKTYQRSPLTGALMSQLPPFPIVAWDTEDARTIIAPSSKV